MSLTFAKRKIIVNIVKCLTVFLLVFLVLGIDIYFLIINTPKVFHLLTWLKIIILTPFIILEFYFIRWFDRVVGKWLDSKIDNYLNNIDNARKGEEGEEIVFEELNSILNPDQYKIRRNFVIPGKKFDLDFIIVGPKGVVVIEVKNHDVVTTFTYDRAFYKSGLGYFKNLFGRDPRNKLEKQIGELDTFLKAKGLENISIRRALLYVNSQSVDIQDGAQNIYKTYVIKGLDGLKKYFDGTFLDSRYDQAFCNKVCGVLNNK